jgi:pimeloyl-ACP methyl ester carboxylesterase
MTMMGKYNYNKIFMRDPRQVWYHWGIEGKTRNVEGTAEYLMEAIASRGIRKVATFGTSGGGYAALMFGWLLSADVVHAFSPQTMLEEDHPRFQVLRQDAEVCPQYFDVKPLLADPNGKTEFHVYYSITAERDKVMAERLQGLPSTHLHRYEEGGHALAAVLTRDGTMDRIIRSMFDEKAA